MTVRPAPESGARPERLADLRSQPWIGVMCTLTWVVLALLATSLAHATVTVEDDSSRTVRLEAPATRIVSLAPHTTEILFAAGAGERVVGAVSYSDYPPAAKEIPRVGSYDAVDFERILGLDPDLVVAWASGNDSATIERLRELGLTVYVSEPRALAAIPRTITRLGRLAGTADTAQTAAERFREHRQRLAERYRDQAPVPVFFQIWHGPTMTINGEHLISRVIELCGGRNVFAELPTLVPHVSTEAVIAADPEAILAAGRDAERPEWLDDWREWPSITAVRRDNLFHLDPDVIHRAGPRVLAGAEAVCEALATTRRHRP
ncbi:cobalamin-binding protein [Arhodomonas sp. AD133]|uniref:cobalamin-binding protein n=1 Tax=Arhodomonas sp. AD133 TaxID=3415009 RepID=UPI003EC13C28